MVSNTGTQIMLFLFLILSISCNKRTVDSHEDYLAWLSEDKNGLMIKKEAGGIIIKVKQLPSNFLAYQDLMNESGIEKDDADSVIAQYNKSLTFLMTIGVDGNTRKGDIMYQGINNYEGYKQQLMKMNFGIEDQISLTIDGQKYRPVLAHLENVYGLGDSRNISFVFTPADKADEAFYKSEKIQFTYDDELFNTGINHFIFDREDINNSPQFDFWK